MNAFIRFKLTLTETEPTILPYRQNDWAQTADVVDTPIRHSLDLLSGLHYRWQTLLKSMSASDFDRIYIHPEYKQRFTLRDVTGLYAWHCSHHLAHVKQAIQHKGEY